MEQNSSSGAELLSPWTSSSAGFYKLYSPQNTVQRERTFWKRLFPNSSGEGKGVGCVPPGSAGEGAARPCVPVAAGEGSSAPESLWMPSRSPGDGYSCHGLSLCWNQLLVVRNKPRGQRTLLGHGWDWTLGHQRGRAGSTCPGSALGRGVPRAALGHGSRRTDPARLHGGFSRGLQRRTDVLSQSCKCWIGQ